MTKEELIQKLNESTDSKEILNLRGKLITLIKKEIKETDDKQLKNTLDMQLYEELKKHKEHIKSMRANKDVKIPLKENVALKVKEIATAMEIFSKKLDLGTILKNSAISTVVATLVTAAISAGIGALTAGTLTLPTLASLLPTASFIGLSNVLSGVITGTQKRKLYNKLDTRKEDYEKEAQFCQENITNNQAFIQCMVNETKDGSIDQKIENEKRLIEEYKKILEKTPSDEINRLITLEMIDVMKKLQTNYDEKISKYVSGRLPLSEEEIDKLQNDKKAISQEITTKSMFAKETAKESLKNFAIGTGTMYASRLMLTPLFPSLAFNTVADVVTPLAYSFINGLINTDNISKKLRIKKFNYTETVIRLNHPELFEQEKQKGVNTSLAMAY